MWEPTNHAVYKYLIKALRGCRASKDVHELLQDAADAIEQLERENRQLRDGI